MPSLELLTEITRYAGQASLAWVRPTGPDLWAIWVLAGLWVIISSFVWGMVRWLRDPSEDEGHRGL